MTLKTALLLGLMGACAACSNNQGGTEVAAGAEPLRPVSGAATAQSAPVAVTDAAAAQNSDGAGVDDSAGSSALTPSTAEECSRRGGTWRRAGMMRLEVCDLPTRDAGKPCRGDAECESVCVAAEGADPSGPVTGQCYKSNITVGTCLTLVEGGRIAQAQCAD